MKDIDIRWIENAKTKSSSLTLVDREPWNDYPENTATVELLGVRKKFPEAKVTFIFPIKADTHFYWDYQSQKAIRQNVDWRVDVQVNLMYNEINKDYDIYINFPSGKYNSPLLNFQEFDIFYRAVSQVKSDLNNILTVNNFS